jgi:hypothetical protein
MDSAALATDALLPEAEKHLGIGALAGVGEVDR